MRIIVGAGALALAAIMGCSNGGGGEASAAASGSGGNSAAAEQPAARPGQQRGVADPRAFVEERYRRIAEDQGDPAAHAYSDRLRSLFSDMNSDAGDELGRLDFDYWSNSQDPDIRNLRIRQEEVFGREDRRVIVAEFSNGGLPNVNTFYFERVGGRWFLDDVRNETRGENGGSWTLSLLLKYGT
jgi:hypothetical protein